MKFPFRTLILISLIGIVIVFAFASNDRFDLISDDKYIAPFDETINLDVTLYFIYDGELRSEIQTIPVNSSNKASSIIDALIAGPRNQIYESPLSNKSQVKSVLVEGNKCFVSLSKSVDSEGSFLSPNHELEIWSIVNSITELNEINYVQFLVNGEKVFSQIGDYQLYDPLPPRVDLVFKRKLTAYNVVTNFFENIDNKRFDLAYDALSEKSHNKYSYAEFVEYMTERNDRFGGYQREMTFTRKIDDDWVVSISYLNGTEDSVISSVVEHLRIVNENDEFKIDL